MKSDPDSHIRGRTKGAGLSVDVASGLRLDFESCWHAEHRKWLLVWRWSFPIATSLGAVSGLRDFATARVFGENMPLSYWLLGEILLFWFWAFFTPSVLMMMRRFPVRRKTWLGNGSIHLLSYIILTGLYTAYYWGVDRLVGPNSAPTLHNDFLHTFSVAISDGLTKYYLPILVAGYLGAYYAQLREKDIRNATLASQLGQAQLRALKDQLQPHFLFNTLHSISSLVYTDARSADQMIAELSDLLRMTLEAEDIDRVPLRQELEYLQKYLAIEKTRFSDRLEVQMHVDPNTLDFPVPYFILQPIVENSIRHGISKKAAGGRICIDTSLDGERLKITVRDDGPGMESPEDPKEGRPGVGLKNTRERLQQFYGDDFSVALEKSILGAKAELSLPRPARPLRT